MKKTYTLNTNFLMKEKILPLYFITYCMPHNTLRNSISDSSFRSYGSKSVPTNMNNTQ